MRTPPPAPLVGTVVANEPDGDTLTYTVSGTDNLIFARTFDYNTTTGEITVKTGAKLDHEIKGSYSISVAVTDGGDHPGRRRNGHRHHRRHRGQ